jgi:opacity protein-like surface antigen
MPELIAVLEAKNKEDYETKRFMAAIQGVDIEKSQSSSVNPMETWEKIKAKANSKGSSTDPKDITTLRGKNAARTGFGIGAGLDYEVI